MLDHEKAPIYLKEGPTSIHLDAIEGLIFDPQPMTYSQIERDEQGNISIPLLEMERTGKTQDPVFLPLARRWNHLVRPSFMDKTGLGKKLIPDFGELPKDHRSYLPNSPLYVTHRSPSVIIEGGRNRTLRVDLFIAKDRLTFLDNSHLHLKDLDAANVEADYFINALGISRGAKSEDLARPYIPNFTEQQRLLLVADLLTQAFQKL